MKPLFKQARAETVREFLQLVRGWKLVFYYVYTDSITTDLSFDLPDAETDELYLAFNLANHSEAAQKSFREVSMIELRLGDPPLRPLPYWGSFVVGMGPMQTVYSIENAREMIMRARREAQMLWKAFEKK